MIRQHAKQRPVVDAQEPMHTRFTPGLLIVKLKRDVVQRTGKVSMRALSLAADTVTIPESVTAPFDLLAHEEHLVDVTPLFPATTRKPRALPAAHTFASRAAPSLLEPADADLAGINVLKLSSKADVARIERELENSPGVEYCHRVPRRWLAVRKKKPAAGDPFVNRQWNLRAINWFQAHPLPDASHVKVAVLDTGFDIGHPDLPDVSVYDHPGSSAKDLIGHGTHVSGIIAARANNAIGISGITSCNLNVWKIFKDEPDEDDGDYYVDDILYHQALNKARRAGVRVINLSIGGTASSRTESLLFKKLTAASVTVVAAMGNDYLNGNPTEFPAAYPGVLAVAATNEANRRASFSSTGPHVAIAAPGENILSTLPMKAAPPRPDETEYAAWDGTSMATPHVTAAAALVLARTPDLRPDEVAKKLTKSATKLKATKTQVGAGLLNIQKALSLK